MKILKPHPGFYKQYKDKILQRGDSSGVVVGYFIENDGSAILVAQEDAKRFTMNLKQFMELLNIKIEDFHGDVNKNFFLINQERIDNGFILSIQ